MSQHSSSELRSTCCNAPVVVSGTGSTHWYCCLKCMKPTEVTSISPTSLNDTIALLGRVAAEWYEMRGILASHNHLPPKSDVKPDTGLQVSELVERLRPLTRREVILIASACGIHEGSIELERLYSFAHAVMDYVLSTRDQA